MKAPPERTTEQRARARERALDARRQRAEARAALSQGRWSLAELLERCQEDEHYGGMRVRDALTALPGIGEVRSLEIMEDVGISPSRRLRGLGSRQQVELLERVAPIEQRRARA